MSRKFYSDCRGHKSPLEKHLCTKKEKKKKSGLQRDTCVICG